MFNWLVSTSQISNFILTVIIYKSEKWMYCKFQRWILSIIFLILSLMLFSCTTVREFPADPPEYRTVTYNEEKNIVINGETYLFFRNYKGEYTNPLDIHSIFKGLIFWGDVNDIDTDHVSLGFSLEDDFWGFTLQKGDGINKYLNREYCLDIEKNRYMIRCNPDESIQTVYALKVKKKEFDKALLLTEKIVNDEDAVYSMKRVLEVGGSEIVRRLFYSKKQKDIQNREGKKESFINEPDEKEFHCSSFIAYVLINSVDSIRNFFEEKGLDYDKITPSDISRIPGVKEIFSSTWSDYDNAAQQFMEFYKKLP